jgi:hypothetical protein
MASEPRMKSVATAAADGLRHLAPPADSRLAGRTQFTRAAAAEARSRASGVSLFLSVRRFSRRLPSESRCAGEATRYRIARATLLRWNEDRSGIVGVFSRMMRMLCIVRVSVVAYVAALYA